MFGKLDNLGKDQPTSIVAEAKFRLAKCLRVCVVGVLESTSRADVETLGGSRSASFCFDQNDPLNFDVEYSLWHSWPVEQVAKYRATSVRLRPASMS